MQRGPVLSLGRGVLQPGWMYAFQLEVTRNAASADSLFPLATFSAVDHVAVAVSSAVPSDTLARSVGQVAMEVLKGATQSPGGGVYEVLPSTSKVLIRSRWMLHGQDDRE